jgi:hypothetical protein
VHDFATLLGFGADGVSPYLAYEALARMNHDGIIKLRSNLEFTNDELFYAYRKAAAKGILKVTAVLYIYLQMYICIFMYVYIYVHIYIILRL